MNCFMACRANRMGSDHPNDAGFHTMNCFMVCRVNRTGSDHPTVV